MFPLNECECCRVCQILGVVELLLLTASVVTAEGTGLEPATGKPASDFESDSSPIRIPSGSLCVPGPEARGKPTHPQLPQTSRSCEVPVGSVSLVLTPAGEMLAFGRDSADLPGITATGRSSRIGPGRAPVVRPHLRRPAAYLTISIQRSCASHAAQECYLSCCDSWHQR